MRLKTAVCLLSIGVMLCSLAGAQAAQQPGADSADMHHAMEMRGDHVMGFPHDKTTHHFLLQAGGGLIQVTANDAKDQPDIDMIRMHRGHISKMFANGNFVAPMLVHDAIPPGTTTMKLLKEKIHYGFVQVDAGGAVHIESTDPVAVAAIHDFLRYQIAEHKTGDPVAEPAQ